MYYTIDPRDYQILENLWWHYLYYTEDPIYSFRVCALFYRAQYFYYLEKIKQDSRCEIYRLLINNYQDTELSDCAPSTALIPPHLLATPPEIDITTAVIPPNLDFNL